MWYLVVPTNHFFKVVEFEDVDDWSKDLMFDDVCIMSNLDDGWLDIVSISSNLLAASEDLATLLLDLLETLQVFFHTLLRVHWAHQGIGIHWITDWH